MSERGAGPVANQGVAVYPVTAQSRLADAPFRGRPAGRCTTDARGICEVSNLAPGVYSADVRPLADPNLSAPSGPAAVVFGTVTLTTNDARARLSIALERGIRVDVHAAAEDGTVPEPMRVEVTRDDGARWERPLDGAGNADLTLGAGRFTAHLVPPDGPILVAASLDGEDLVTPDVAFELSPPGPDRFVAWTLSATCGISGIVKSTRKEPGVAVRASLVTPGPWTQTALCRATRCAGSPIDHVAPNGWYGIQLPPGTWRVEPVGASLISSTPPYVDRTLGDGDQARVDFDVVETPPDDAKTAALRVRVRDPEGKPVDGARVELWPPDGDSSQPDPLLRATTGPWTAPAFFEKVEAGSYLVRARAAGYAPGVVPLTGFDPEAQRARTMTIDLTRGATIDASVRDANELPVTGIALDVLRVDDRPPSDPVERLARSEAQVSTPPSTDQTGHVVVSGLTAATYRVTPSRPGTLGARTRLTIAREREKGGESADVTLGPADRASLDVRVLPAASLTGRLACADGRPIPRAGKACLVSPDEPDDVDPASACGENGDLSLSIALAGDAHDAFEVGPLDRGSYRLAIRPEGYDAWTWALGTPDAKRAARIPVDGTAPIDLGTIAVLCGPAIELRPKVASDDPLPDLTEATVEGTLTRKGTDGKVETRTLTADRYRDRVVFRELPEGSWTLDATIAHPCFLPAAPVTATASELLERGKIATEHPIVPAVGGAVVVRGSLAAARLLRGEDSPRIAEANDGVATFPGVAPGTYALEACADPDCTRVIGRWARVAVHGGTTAEIAAGDGRTSPPR